MATIANLQTLVSANTSGFVKNIGKAQKGLNGFLNRLGGMKSMLAGVGASLGAGFAVRGISNLVGDQMEAIDATAKLADRLNIATESLSGLQYAAGQSGSSAEGLSKSLDVMNKNLGAAVMGGGPAAKMLDQLGLSASTLASQDPSTTFRQIADAISALPTPAEQAAAAVAIFGKSGAELLPVLKLGTSGLDEMQKRAEMLGLSLTRVEAAQVEQAGDALADIGSLFKGIGNQLAIGIAPYLEGIANSTIKWATTGTNLKDTVGAGIEFVVEAVKYLADYWDGAIILVESFGVVGGKAISMYLQGIELMVKAVSYLPEWLGGGVASKIDDGIDKIQANIAALEADLQKRLVAPDWSKQIDRNFSRWKAESAAAAQQAAEAQAEATQKAQDAVAGNAVTDFLGSKASAIFGGLTDTGKGLFDMAAPKGKEIFGGVIEGIEEVQNRAEQMNRDLDQSAANIFDSTRTPMEKFEAEMKQLQTLLDMGKITQDTFDRASTDAFRGIIDDDEQKDIGPPKAIAALERGTAAAFAAERQLESPEKTQKEIRDLNKEQRDLLAEAIKAIREGKSVAGVFPSP